MLDDEISRKRKREIIDLMIKRGLLTQEMIEKSREESKRTGLAIVKSLEDLGFISEEDFTQAEAEVLGVPYLDLNGYRIDTKLLNLITKDISQKNKVLPLFKVNDVVSIGMVDSQDITALDRIRRKNSNLTFEPILISETAFQKMYVTYYEDDNSDEEISNLINQGKLAVASNKDFIETTGETPIIKLVNYITSNAVKEKASDIHIEPIKEGLRIRNRIDGVLREKAVLPVKMQSAFISRIKIMAEMDIAESRKPQDGRIRLTFDDRDVDFRVSSMPSVYGENVVMRILDKSSMKLGLNRIGLSAKDVVHFEKLIKSPNGIVLVTGPTGSGKTSTLYCALSTINSMEKNIITLENPVEYELPLIRQTQINPKAGVTFASGLRTILRQDPDIIMLGEIRDYETAEVATQAALTGHLVLSTLHTNDSCSSLTRLIDMGVEPFLISTSVIGILAQRLVRRICEQCKAPLDISKEVLKDLNLQDGKFFKGKGCELCNKSGYLGRLAIVELLVMNEKIRRMVDDRKSADEIKTYALSQGLTTLRESGLKNVRDGLTTLEEVLSITAK